MASRQRSPALEWRERMAGWRASGWSVREFVSVRRRTGGAPRGIAWSGYLSEVGRSVASWSAGVRGSLVRICWSQVQGFTPNCWHVAVKLDRIARRRPPSSLPKKSQFLRPMAYGFTARSARLLSIASAPSVT